jgi:hypothetical protein
MVGLAAMLAALAYGINAGGLMEDGARIVGLPWGIVTLVDIYVGFFLFSCWIVYRESKPGIAAAWIVALMSLGNLVSCCYVLWAAQRSKGDAASFWMGDKARRENSQEA